MVVLVVMAGQLRLEGRVSLEDQGGRPEFLILEVLLVLLFPVVFLIRILLELYKELLVVADIQVMVVMVEPVVQDQLVARRVLELWE